MKLDIKLELFNSSSASEGIKLVSHKDTETALVHAVYASGPN